MMRKVRQIGYEVVGLSGNPVRKVPDLESAKRLVLRKASPGWSVATVYLRYSDGRLRRTGAYKVNASGKLVKM